MKLFEPGEEDILFSNSQRPYPGEMVLETFRGLNGPRPGEECECSSRVGDEDEQEPQTEECHIFCPVCHSPIRTARYKVHVREVHGYVECGQCGYDVDPETHAHHPAKMQATRKGVRR